MLARKSKEPWKYGCLKVKGEKLEEIVEKPEKGKEPSSLVNAGVYRFSKEIFEAIEKIEKSNRGELELTDAINLLAGKENSCFMKAEEEVKDIGCLKDLEKK